MGTISQDSRADGKFNLSGIKDLSFLAIKQDKNTSDLEKRVLQKLYSEYKRSGKKTKWKATEMFKELEIQDEQDVSTLNDSKYLTIELDDTHECYVITTEGIRYMDSQ